MLTNLSNLGVFMPAVWTIPENPLDMGPGPCGMGAIVNGIYRACGNGVVAELKAKQATAAAIQANPNGPVGLACGPSSCACQVGLCGLDGTLDDVLSSVTGSMGNWQTWAMVGAGVLALVMFTGGGGSQRSAELAAARAQYKSKVASIRASRPRRYQKYV